MISRPDLLKERTSNKNYAKITPQTSFLAPEGTNRIELAKILENAALNLRNKEYGGSLFVTTNKDLLCRNVFKKKFGPKNQDPVHKQRKQK